MKCKNVSEPAGEQMDLFSLAGSLNYANRTALPGNAEAKTTNATSGRKCLEQFARFPHVGLWAKTFSELLIGTGGWFSMRCKLTWKLKGTKYKRMYFQLVPKTHRTEETGFGLLPTPQAMDMMQNPPRKITPTGRIISNQGHNGSAPLKDLAMNKLLPTPTVMDTNHCDLNKIDERRARAKAAGKNGNGFGATIGELANRGLLPTPTSRDEKNGGKLEDGRIQRKIQQGFTVELNDLATMGLLPTPMSQDGQNSTAPASQAGRDTLPGMVAATGTTSQLNPRFVLEMMGFPPDWTELPFLSGETKV